MSLVINSNETWMIKYSDTVFDGWSWYPDFNQILIKPSFWQIVALPSAVETVNWTAIHNLSSNIREDTRNYCPSDYWQWWIAVCWWRTSWSSTVSNLLVATPKSLTAWKTVWKEIIYAWILWTASSADYIKERAWILHTDWSITYMTEEQTLSPKNTWMEYGASGANTVNNLFYDFVSLKMTTSWFVTAEGDRIVVNISMQRSSNSNRWWFVWFWHDCAGACISFFSSSNTIIHPWMQIPCCPIQVSIE